MTEIKSVSESETTTCDAMRQSFRHGARLKSHLDDSQKIELEDFNKKLLIHSKAWVCAPEKNERLWSDWFRGAAVGFVAALVWQRVVF